MLKQHLLKLVLGLAIIAALIGGFSAEHSAAAAKVTPAHHLLACAYVYPACV